MTDDSAANYGVDPYCVPPEQRQSVNPALQSRIDAAMQAEWPRINSDSVMARVIQRTAELREEVTGLRIRLGNIESGLNGPSTAESVPQPPPSTPSPGGAIGELCQHIDHIGAEMRILSEITAQLQSTLGSVD